MSEWTNPTKSSKTWDNQKKSDLFEAGLFDHATFDQSQFEDLTKRMEGEWKNYIRCGKELEGGTLNNYTFEDIIVLDNKQMENVPMNRLEEGTWTNQSKS